MEDECSDSLGLDFSYLNCVVETILDESRKEAEDMLHLFLSFN